MDLPVRYADLGFGEKRLVREEYARIQGGACRHCRAPLTGDPDEAVRRKRVDARLFPRGFFEHPVHLHHSRRTGMTVGAVHAKCNAVLWQHHGR